jgi:hypothetical protein
VGVQAAAGLFRHETLGVGTVFAHLETWAVSMMQDLMTLLAFQLFPFDLKGLLIGPVDRDHRKVTPDDHKGSIMGIDEVIQFDVFFHRLPFLLAFRLFHPGDASNGVSWDCIEPKLLYLVSIQKSPSLGRFWNRIRKCDFLILSFSKAYCF